MGILILFLIGFVYLIPSIVAISNKKDNSAAIFALNLFLGWMLIPWVVALTWAMCKDKEGIVQIFNDNHKESSLGYIRGGE